jgi:peroxiredoxin
MKRLLIPILLLFAVSIISAQEATKKVAPNFELETIEDETVELSDFLGEGPVLINFWATWCKPCVEEMKYYQEIYDKHKADGMKMLAISEDTERSVAKVLPYIKANNYNFTVLLDPDNAVARDFYVRVVPHTYILNSEGEIVYSHSGYKKGDEKEVERIITELLGEKEK